jgi:hypothetical protein
VRRAFELLPSSSSYRRPRVADRASPLSLRLQGSDSDDSDVDDRAVDDVPADVRGTEAFDGIPTGGTAAGVDDSVADKEVDDGAFPSTTTQDTRGGGADPWPSML